MNQLRMGGNVDELTIVACEQADGDGVGILQGKDYIALTWVEAGALREWLAYALGEHFIRQPLVKAAQTKSGSQP